MSKNQGGVFLQQYIYLVLSSSSSLPAKVIKRVCKNQLNHSSISIDDSLDAMYSFGRVNPYNLFSAKFVKESKNKGFYKRFKDTYIKVYRLPVTDEVFENTKNYLADWYENRDEYSYSYLGLLLASVNYPLEREHRYYCSEFVAKVFEDCSIRDLNNRDIHTYRPYYFEELDDIELIYEGLFAEYDNYNLESPSNLIFQNQLVNA